MGYIAFRKPLTRQDRIIACLDGGLFCHCELMIEQNYDGSYKTVSSTNKTGVRIRNVTLNSDKWVKIPVDVDVAHCLAWYERHKHANYDYLGLITSRFSFIPHHHGKWYCSEAVAAMLKLNKAENWGVKDLYERYA